MMKNGATNVTVSRPRRTRRAFTLIELIVVVILLVLMAGVALPVYFEFDTQARQSATKGALGGVRVGAAQFLIDQVVNGSAPTYPTLLDLTTPGTVMLDTLPENPYKGSNSVSPANAAEAAARATVGGPEGWRYYVDNAATPPEYVFYSNSNAAGSNDW
jgi:prepilin-type N-terminal cleavage/methylation domain-containing protein